jgi:hypothetical protein
VSDSPTLHSKWLILKGTHPRTIPAIFGLIWFSSFRGKDLNVIFYQAAVTKNRNFYTLLQIKMKSNFNCSYMAMSSLAYILGLRFKCDLLSKYA